MFSRKMLFKRAEQMELQRETTREHRNKIFKKE
jgi:hypothetical protein